MFCLLVKFTIHETDALVSHSIQLEDIIHIYAEKEVARRYKALTVYRYILHRKHAVLAYSTICITKFKLLCIHNIT